MNNILITGASGQLGQALKNNSINNHSINLIFANKKLLNITDYDQCELFIKNYSLSYIINCAAYTNVDQAEQLKTNKPNKSNIVHNTNATGPKNLAIIADKYDIKLIHISTDYVYKDQHHTPLQEPDPTIPINYYGETKLQGEANITNNLKNYIIIRTGWLYYYLGHNFFNTITNLIKTKQSLNIVSDQFGTPTYCGDLAEFIYNIINKDLANKDNNYFNNIYNFSNLGACSWYDFATTINEYSECNCKINAITTEEYPTPAKRPKYSVLDKSKAINTFDYNIPSWREGLVRCLKQRNITFESA